MGTMYSSNYVCVCVCSQRWLKSYQGETHQPQGAEGEITADSDTKGCGPARKQRPPPLSSLTESGSDKENHGNQVARE